MLLNLSQLRRKSVGQGQMFTLFRKINWEKYRPNIYQFILKKRYLNFQLWREQSLKKLRMFWQIL